MPLKILIADDHPAITLAVRSQLRNQTGWEVCADVHSSAELLQAVRAFRPDIVVTDYHMPCSNASDGIRLLASLRRHFPALGVVVLTMITNPLVLRAILNAGAHGLLLRTRSWTNWSPPSSASSAGCALSVTPPRACWISPAPTTHPAAPAPCACRYASPKSCGSTSAATRSPGLPGS